MKRLMNSLTTGLITLPLLAQSTFAATLSFNPNQGKLIVNCPQQVQILIDTQNQETTAIDVSVLANASGYTLNKFDYSGGLFKSYTAPKLVTLQDGQNKGKQGIHILASTLSRRGVNGSGLVGTLLITPLQKGELKLMFNYVPNSDGDDSNIAVISPDGQSASDALKGVQNATLSVVDGACPDASLAHTNGVTTGVENAIFYNLAYKPQFAADERRDAFRQRFFTTPGVKYTTYTAGSALILRGIARVIMRIRKKPMV